ncbi:MAG: photosystem II protein Y [Trichodesmium sp. St15_bin1_1]|jgi:photosystem II PsbY protein|nr:photosystem II protein Y [Trichodesmium sp. St5_bin2_1]MDE5080250.1 photosystem II protein Y [Trichodesmium sp. St18_bin1]MDE5089730.1 photosystem II protein Y [Trichodesmium sp. St16_bin2-tuft]MDE5112744.1 photosystem II protein Y [Trichodesmium sp. St15_bin1_1]MDE5116132.1 photosystem II protein Y [Trichodesmium sp. St2_bin2_1]MDE5123417.1 photosystem II protein Y [Trichodesmium sp. St19_bin1]
MDFDFRLLIVLLPIVAAGAWAVFNIGVLAAQQLQKFLNK